MSANKIYYRFKCEVKEESLIFDEPEITAGDLKVKIRQAKFNNAPEKFELILKDSTNNRDYLDTEYIKSKTIVLVLRMPGHMPLNNSLYVQPIEDMNRLDEVDEKENEEVKDQKEEEWDKILLNYNVRRGHRLYPLLKDSKFFIIKCANEKNLETSQKNDEWATTTFNQDKLDKAFQSCTNVILFFSVNKSAHFQGMAKMISGLTSRVSREWQTEGVRLGYSFKVKWIVTSNMPFSTISALKTPSNEPIRKARDTTEIGMDAGIQIALKIDECRVGEIDLPSSIAGNPNFDLNKLSAMDIDFGAQKAAKADEMDGGFDLFEDFAKKEEMVQELPVMVENEEKPASKEAPSKVVEEEKPAIKISDLEAVNFGDAMQANKMGMGWNYPMPYMQWPRGYPVGYENMYSLLMKIGLCGCRQQTLKRRKAVIEAEAETKSEAEAEVRIIAGAKIRITKTEGIQKNISGEAI